MSPRWLRGSLLGLSTLLAGGCINSEDGLPATSARETGEPKAGEPKAGEDVLGSSPVPKDAQAVAALLNQVGDGPVLAFVVRPDRWASTRDAVKPMLNGVPGGAEVAAMAGSVEQLVAFAGTSLGLKLDLLEGIDWTRPVVGGLAEPPTFEPLAMPEAKLDAKSYRDFGIHHVLFVPISDGKAFVGSLSPALGGRLMATEAWSAAPSWTGRNPDGEYVYATTQGDYARVDVFTDLMGVDEAETKTALLARVATDSEPLPKTPALEALATDDSLLAVHVRPWRFRGLSTWSGRHSLVRALETAPPEYRSMMMAKGLSIVLTSEMLMSDVGAEFDDWTWTFSAAGGQANVRAVASLTPHGRKAFDAAGSDVALVGSKLDSAPAAASLRISIDEALDAVDPPPALKSFRRPSEMVQAFQECGPGCLAHAAHRVPLQSLELVMTLLAEEGAPLAGVSAAQAVLASYNPPAGVIALIHDSAEGAGKTRSAIGALAGSELPVEQATRGSETVVTVGLGMKAADAFAMTEQPSIVLLEASISGKGSGTPFEGLHGALRLERRGPALVVQAAARSGSAPELADAPNFEGITWASPILSFPGADRSECLLEVVVGIRKSFEAVAMVAPEQRATLLAKAIAEIEQADACASGSSMAHKKAKQLTELAGDLLKSLDPPVVRHAP